MEIKQDQGIFEKIKQIEEWLRVYEVLVAEDNYGNAVYLEGIAYLDNNWIVFDYEDNEIYDKMKIKNIARIGIAKQEIDQYGDVTHLKEIGEELCLLQ